jgi:hypothetical protein
MWALGIGGGEKATYSPNVLFSIQAFILLPLVQFICIFEKAI